ncbi:unnamed protein product [Diplocarpon coronariae]
MTMGAGFLAAIKPPPHIHRQAVASPEISPPAGTALSRHRATGGNGNEPTHHPNWPDRPHGVALGYFPSRSKHAAKPPPPGTLDLGSWEPAAAFRSSPATQAASQDASFPFCCGRSIREEGAHRNKIHPVQASAPSSPDIYLDQLFSDSWRSCSGPADFQDSFSDLHTPCTGSILRLLASRDRVLTAPPHRRCTPETCITKSLWVKNREGNPSPLLAGASRTYHAHGGVYLIMRSIKLTPDPAADPATLDLDDPRRCFQSLAAAPNLIIPAVSWESWSSGSGPQSADIGWASRMTCNRRLQPERNSRLLAILQRLCDSEPPIKQIPPSADHVSLPEQACRCWPNLLLLGVSRATHQRPWNSSNPTMFRADSWIPATFSHPLATARAGKKRMVVMTPVPSGSNSPRSIRTESAGPRNHRSGAWQPCRRGDAEHDLSWRLSPRQLSRPSRPACGRGGTPALASRSFRRGAAPDAWTTSTSSTATPVTPHAEREGTSHAELRRDALALALALALAPAARATPLGFGAAAQLGETKTWPEDETAGLDDASPGMRARSRPGLWAAGSGARGAKASPLISTGPVSHLDPRRRRLGRLPVQAVLGWRTAGTAVGWDENVPAVRSTC